MNPDRIDIDGLIEEEFQRSLVSIRGNNPYMTEFNLWGHDNRAQNFTEVDWEQLGRDIVNNTYIKELSLHSGVLSDHKKMSSLFRGLMRSNSIERMNLRNNELSVVGVRSMVPFLQNANNLIHLNLNGNNIQSEGFNIVLRALRISPIEDLICIRCGIESIDIDSEHIPRNLVLLNLRENAINADGCRGLAKLLQEGNATLERLHLNNNKIDDDGVEILVDVLRNNTSLKEFHLGRNDGISSQGKVMLLKLVNDISSIKATLQSNHTLEYVMDEYNFYDEIQTHINMATKTNREERTPGAAGREKVIGFQLHNRARAELAALQGINHSVYSTIDSLHLPDALSLIDRHHGHAELYVALKSSIVGLFSRVNMKECIQKQSAYHAAKIEEYRAMIAEHEAKLQEYNARLAKMEG